ncbi:MAG: WG repeat-containing protein [Maribacter sp.]|nr:WG repeat-containing protein [Maribacter sp.]
MISIAVLLLLPILLFAQTIKDIDEIAPFSEGLAAVRKGSQWGFISKQGTLVIGFRNDLHWNKDADNSNLDITGIRYPMFKEGRCIIKKIEHDIALFGFIDMEGKTVIEPQFLNVTQFYKGYASGVRCIKVYKGSKEFRFKLYDYEFDDVLVGRSGKIEEFLGKRENIHMTKKRYELPMISSKMLSENLVAVRTPGDGWEIRKLNLP